jgi:hypothetical protein
MKMNKIITIVLGLFFALVLTNCKKYPDGGFVHQTNKHLLGANKVGSSKIWKLKLYEVNGIDSTHLIQGANTIPDFYDKFVTFKYSVKEVSIQHITKTFTQNYIGYVDNKDKKILFAYDWLSHEDSMQCKKINNQLYCQRNVFFPEFLTRNPAWNINKLTKDELILKIELSNSYKIILTK